MLSFIPTPIGNLKDITLRALETLKAADTIVCEDTRHTSKLLMHYEISKPLISFHEHSGGKVLENVLAKAEAGEKIALVTDAGMPLISDPGFELVREAVRRNIPFEVLPGPQAAVTALAASGLAPDSFVFLGFLPQKPGKRKKEIERVKEYPETLIFYESPFRLVKSLTALHEILGDREAAVARELTKKFEEVARGTLSALAGKFEKKEARGEIVLVVSGKDRKLLLDQAEKDEDRDE